MWLFLEPKDVLLFRDSRPFTAGEAHLARSMFPPNPTTVMGAVRAAVLSRAFEETGHSFDDYYAKSPDLKELGEAIGFPDEGYGSLWLKGPYLSIWDTDVDAMEIFLPIPLDILFDPSGRPAMMAPLMGRPMKYATSEPDLPLLWIKSEAPGSPEGLEDAFIEGHDLEDYLTHNMTSDIRPVPPGVLYKREFRTGIGMDRSRRTSETGLLYTVEMVRMPPERKLERYGILCQVSGVEDDLLANEGLLKLGGEQRPVAYHRLLTSHPAAAGLERLLSGTRDRVRSILDSEGSEGRFKLYLTTPAVFQGDAGATERENGWLPDFVVSRRESDGTMSWVCEKGGLFFEIVGAAIGKPGSLSGWDLKEGRPKPLMRTVPAGSVYYCILTQGTVEELMDTFWFKSIVSSLDRQTGLGITLVGSW